MDPIWIKEGLLAQSSLTQASLLHLQLKQARLWTAGGGGIIALVFVEGVTTLV